MRLKIKACTCNKKNLKTLRINISQQNLHILYISSKQMFKPCFFTFIFLSQPCRLTPLLHSTLHLLFHFKFAHPHLSLCQKFLPLPPSPQITPSLSLCSLLPLSRLNAILYPFLKTPRSFFVCSTQYIVWTLSQKTPPSLSLCSLLSLSSLDT